MIAVGLASFVVLCLSGIFRKDLMCMLFYLVSHASGRLFAETDLSFVSSKHEDFVLSARHRCVEKVRLLFWKIACSETTDYSLETNASKTSTGNLSPIRCFRVSSSETLCCTDAFASLHCVSAVRSECMEHLIDNNCAPVGNLVRQVAARLRPAAR